MKIIEASAGPLTNFEVLDFLRKKSASTIEEEKDSKIKNGEAEAGEDNESDRIKRRLTPSEMKVYDYLVDTAARDQTWECVSEFLQRCKKYELAQADILNLLNLRPSAPSATVELYAIVESFDERYENQDDEILQMIDAVLPPRPTARKNEEELVPLETIKVGTETQQDNPQPEPMIEG